MRWGPGRHQVDTWPRGCGCSTPRLRHEEEEAASSRRETRVRGGVCVPLDQPQDPKAGTSDSMLWGPAHGPGSSEVKGEDAASQQGEMQGFRNEIFFFLLIYEAKTSILTKAGRNEFKGHPRSHV